MAHYGSGLRIIDISNPASAALVGGLPTSGEACGITISGNYAYVAENYGG